MNLWNIRESYAYVMFSIIRVENVEMHYDVTWFMGTRATQNMHRTYIVIRTWLDTCDFPNYLRVKKHFITIIKTN